MERRDTKVPLSGLVVVLWVIVAYVAAYCVLQTPQLYVAEFNAGMIISGNREPAYRFGGRASEIVFYPLAWIDHKIRPKYWDDVHDSW